MLEDSSVSLPTLATIVVMSVTWAGSVAGVYFGLRNRVASGEARMDRMKVDLDSGSSKFAAIDTKFDAIGMTTRDYGERLVRLETLLGSMDGKLNNILTAVSQHT